MVGGVVEHDAGRGGRPARCATARTARPGRPGSAPAGDAELPQQCRPAPPPGRTAVPVAVAVQVDEEVRVRDSGPQQVGQVYGERGLADSGHPVDDAHDRHRSAARSSWLPAGGHQPVPAGEVADRRGRQRTAAAPGSRPAPPERRRPGSAGAGPAAPRRARCPARPAASHGPAGTRPRRRPAAPPGTAPASAGPQPLAQREPLDQPDQLGASRAPGRRPAPAPPSPRWPAACRSSSTAGALPHRAASTPASAGPRHRSRASAQAMPGRSPARPRPRACGDQPVEHRERPGRSAASAMPYPAGYGQDRVAPSTRRSRDTQVCSWAARWPAVGRPTPRRPASRRATTWPACSSSMASTTRSRPAVISAWPAASGPRTRYFIHRQSTAGSRARPHQEGVPANRLKRCCRRCR